MEQGNFLKNYLVNSKKNIFLNEFSDFSANEEPKVIAVSIYTKNNKGIKKKLLISITSAYYCCTPKIEGHSYQVSIYEIDRQGENLKLQDISKKLLKDNTSGFEGKTDENVSYEYKDISSIKKWLDKNYK